MMRGEGACLVCGKPLIYFETARELECSFCGGHFSSYASCEDGHYICDACHSKKGVDAVLEYCLNCDSRNPVAIMQALMENPYIYMHGPEHHVLVGAALLTAYANTGGALDLPAALQEMARRGASYPGGACGLWGCCGAAVSAGMYMSIITGATPLSAKPWRYANLLTSRCLQAIAMLGGPRCCKRNSFTAAREAVQFTCDVLGIEMELPAAITCGFSDENAQCLRRACPYHPE